MIGKVAFNHEGPATKASDKEGKPCLVQGNVRFTNAEYNRFAKRWEPEPVPLDYIEESKLKVYPVIMKLIESLGEISEQLSGMTPVIRDILQAEKTAVDKVVNPGEYEDRDIQPTEWMQLRSPGYADWLEENRDRIEALAPGSETIRAMKEKFDRLYPTEPFPFNVTEEGADDG